MIIKVKSVRVYGRIRYYPENEIAKKLSRLLRRRTFTHEDLQLATDLFKAKVNVIPENFKGDERTYVSYIISTNFKEDTNKT